MLARIRAVSEAALESGSLKPLDTEQTLLPGNGRSPPFLLRLLRKHEKPHLPLDKNNNTNDNEKKNKNPFLPYDPTLYVADIPPAHVLLLNKFPVLSDHTLIVTAAYEPQSSLLTEGDHEAMWRGLAELPALAFYNAGPIAGASQRHKHLQLVPTPLVGSWTADTPFDEILRPSCPTGIPYAAPGLPFLHAAVAMNDVAESAARGDINSAATISMQRYTNLISILEPRVLAAASATTMQEQDPSLGDIVRPFSYNLLVTARWMLLVPRREEYFQDISINSLGFAGCLLVKDEKSMKSVQEAGGLAVLSAVTFQGDGE